MVTFDKGCIDISGIWPLAIWGQNNSISVERNDGIWLVFGTILVRCSDGKRFSIVDDVRQSGKFEFELFARGIGVRQLLPHGFDFGRTDLRVSELGHFHDGTIYENVLFLKLKVKCIRNTKIRKCRNKLQILIKNHFKEKWLFTDSFVALFYNSVPSASSNCATMPVTYVLFRWVLLRKLVYYSNLIQKQARFFVKTWQKQVYTVHTRPFFPEKTAWINCFPHYSLKALANTFKKLRWSFGTLHY